MNLLDPIKKFLAFLKEDTWQSWIVSLILAFVIIKFIFFPLLSLGMATPLPLVVVESCSMYHESEFDLWWNSNAAWYETHGIAKSEFRDFPFKNGLNKGDIILVTGRGGYELGDIIIFNSDFRFPLIHRIVTTDPVGTKGDNNFDQLSQETEIPENTIVGKSLVRIPALGWVKLIFFEATRAANQRGFCK